MDPYHKIESVYVRDEKTHKFIDGAWRLPEFEYLAGNEWICEEKLDGTNIRVQWNGQAVRFGGKTDKAQIPMSLLDRLNALFTADKMEALWPIETDEEGNFLSTDVCLYGEGIGAGIQKGGGHYKADGVDFVLFDVKVGPWWLRREDVGDVAERLGLTRAPVVQRGTLTDAIETVRAGFHSAWGPFLAEGLVCRPAVDLFARNGDRIITKIKTKDW